MYLLSGESLTKAEWFRPERQPLNLDGQKSTSSLTIGPEAPEIPIGAWMLDDEDPGAGIVWRVKTVDTQFETKTRTVQLEHIVNTLKDISIFGEIAPKNITGNAGSTTCTARQAFEFILARHDCWQLGTMAGEFENISNPYSFNGEDLLSAMETITSSLEDAYWDFDLTSLPFRVNILKLGEDVGCEMRMSRNITTLRKTVDRSRMYTRIYPIGENDIHIDGDYISQNVDSYGLVVKIETDSSKKTKAELLQWAQERLARHCEPSVTITISGIELSEATGEPLDHFREHTKCRVPLPEFGTTITEKVTKLSWRDKIHEKKNVTITLANQREDIASIVNRINKKNGAGARAKAKKDKEDHAWFVDTEDHVGMVAEAIIGQGPDGVDWSRVASLIVDGEGIHGRVTRAEGYLVTMQSSLDMNEESLRIAFETAESLRSSFVMSAESLRIAFENEITSTRSEIRQTADTIALVVEPIYGEDGETIEDYGIKPAKIEASIGKEGSTVKIDANHIRIGGKNSTINLNDVMTINNSYTRMLRPVEFGDTSATSRTQINGGTVKATHYDTGNGGDVRIYKSDGSGPFTINYASWGALLTQVSVQGGSSNSFSIVDNSGNTYKIEKSGDDLLFKDVTNDVSWTFSKAASGPISGDWSGTTADALLTLSSGTNNYYVRFGGQDAGASQYLGISAGNVDTSYGTNGFNKTAMLIKVPINLKSGTYNSSSQDVTYNTTRHTQDVYVDGTAAYNVGKNDGSAGVTLNDPTWNALSGATIPSSRTVTVSTSGRKNSSGTTDNLEKTVTVEVSVDSSKAYIKHSGTTVAEIAHSYKYTTTQYNNAENVGRNAVTLEEPTWNSISGALPASRTVTVKTSGRKNTSGLR